jgi:hypothetical protein
LPDLGNFCIKPGKIANNVNGIAKAKENPNIPIIGFKNAPCEAAIRIDPASGPVQEKETSTSVKAIKNTPMKPPLSDFASTVFTKFDGNTISNAPRNEIPNKINMVKKSIFGIQCVLKKFAKLAPAKKANRVPKNT